MNDPNVDEVSVKFKGDKVLLKWKYPNGPYHYRWFKH
jgi:hypothetical protein